MDYIPKQSFHSISVLYGSMSLFLTIIHNIFLLYYVDMFVSIYKIDKMSFWIGEIIFLIWNSLNDPLFGWLSDRGLLLPKHSSYGKNFNGHCRTMDVVLSRMHILSKAGPLFAFSFSLFWFQWLPTSLQFALCLCIYDAFLTCVDLQHTALLADLAVYASDRAKLNKFSSIFSSLGSISVFLSYIFWNKEAVYNFQMFCSLIAIFSGLGFFFCARQLTKVWRELMNQTTVSRDAITKQSEVNSNSNSLGLKTYVRQLASNRNFLWFISMNLVQVFHCHFNSNFFPLFMDALVGDSLSPGIGPLLIGVSFVLPHINNLYFLSLCDTHGVYHVIRWLFYVKLLLAVVMLLIGQGSVLMLCLFIASNRVFTEGTCKLLNLVISDLVDEDYVQHDREQAASAVLFGMSSLLSKPGQTLAPLLGTWLLALYTGEDVFQGSTSSKPRDSWHELLGWPDQAHHSWMSRKEACFWLLVTIPIACSLLQLLAWSRFTLHGTKLNQIKSIRLSRTAGHSDMV